MGVPWGFGGGEGGGLEVTVTDWIQASAGCDCVIRGRGEKFAPPGRGLFESFKEEVGGGGGRLRPDATCGGKAP